MSSTSNRHQKKVVSPCVGKCQWIENNICMGCYRLTSEIGGWLRKSEHEKKEIVLRCQERKIQHLQEN